MINAEQINAKDTVTNDKVIVPVLYVKRNFPSSKKLNAPLVIFSEVIFPSSSVTNLYSK